MIRERRRRTALLLVVGCLICRLTGPIQAAVPEAGPAQLAVHVHVLQHQRVDDAVQLVYRLLSEDGTVELRPGGSTLVVRDTSEALERIVPALDDFDHPPRAVRLHLQIVRAGGDPASGPPPAELSEEVSARLRQLLRFESFALLSEGFFTVREGEEVDLRMGDSYAVGFRLGTVMGDERLRLQGFRLERRSSPAPAVDAPATGPEGLVHTHLNLWLGEPMVLGLSRAEASDNALMVIVTATPEIPAHEIVARGDK